MRFNLFKVKFSESDYDKNISLPVEMSTDLAEELGLHIGDGSMNYYTGKGMFQLRGHITDDRLHYQTRIRRLYKDLFNLQVNIREMTSTGVIGFQIWSDALVSFKHEVFGLPLGRKADVKIPSVVNSRTLFYSFTRGLFDTDGSVHIENKRGKPYPRIDLRTVSQPLCFGVHRLLNKYGIHATKYVYVRKQEKWHNLYSVIIRGFDSVNKWIKHIGSNNPKHLRKLDPVALGYIDGPAGI